jgi:hypothetical protein
MLTATGSFPHIAALAMSDLNFGAPPPGQLSSNPERVFFSQPFHQPWFGTPIERLGKLAQVFFLLYGFVTRHGAV